MDEISISAVLLSGALIFTTIQAQDFADVEGDTKLGRVTLPIYAPELSRQLTFIALVAWSAFLGSYWKVDLIYRVAFGALGAVVGYRYFSLRSTDCDRISYLLYNVR